MTAEKPPAVWWSPAVGVMEEYDNPWPELPSDAVRLVPLPGRPSPAQWAAWFRSCADMADPDELSDDHRKVFRLVAEHFESAHVVRMAGEITGVDQ